MAKVTIIVDHIEREGWADELVTRVLSLAGNTDFYVQDTPKTPSTVELVAALCRNVGFYVNSDGLDESDVLVYEDEGDDMAFAWRWEEKRSGRVYRVRVEIKDDEGMANDEPAPEPPQKSKVQHHYAVQWTYSLFAYDEVAAVKEAVERLQDPKTTSTWFKVYGMGEPKEINGERFWKR